MCEGKVRGPGEIDVLFQPSLSKAMGIPNVLIREATLVQRPWRAMPLTRFSKAKTSTGYSGCSGVQPTEKNTMKRTSGMSQYPASHCENSQMNEIPALARVVDWCPDGESRPATRNMPIKAHVSENNIIFRRPTLSMREVPVKAPAQEVRELTKFKTR